MGQIRIIGGKWRGRQIMVGNHPGLRPTPDRVRETLFNWLQQDVVQSSCLDLFAGTGILGFEALSRGASHVTFIDNNTAAIQAITKVAHTLDAQNCTVIKGDALAWLRQNNKTSPFDIIFLDPPFSSNLLAECLKELAQSTLVGPSTLLYIEASQVLTPEQLPHQWHCLKQKSAGEVAYHLIQGAPR